MKEITKEFQGKGLDKLLETCMFANMKEDVQMQYVRRLMAEKDRIGQLATAKMQGREQGRAEGRAEGRELGHEDVARTMKAQGISIDLIAKYTGLTPEQIEAF